MIPRNQGKPWDKKQLNILYGFVTQGKSVAHIAFEMGRSIVAIEMQMERIEQPKRIDKMTHTKTLKTSLEELTQIALQRDGLLFYITEQGKAVKSFEKLSNGQKILVGNTVDIIETVCTYKQNADWIHSLVDTTAFNKAMKAEKQYSEFIHVQLLNKILDDAITKKEPLSLATRIKEWLAK